MDALEEILKTSACKSRAQHAQTLLQNLFEYEAKCATAAAHSHALVTSDDPTLSDVDKDSRRAWQEAWVNRVSQARALCETEAVQADYALVAYSDALRAAATKAAIDVETSSDTAEPPAGASTEDTAARVRRALETVPVPDLTSADARRLRNIDDALKTLLAYASAVRTVCSMRCKEFLKPTQIFLCCALPCVRTQMGEDSAHSSLPASMVHMLCAAWVHSREFPPSAKRAHSAPPRRVLSARLAALQSAI